MDVETTQPSQSPPATTFKRRQSDTSNHESKRPRLSSTASKSPTTSRTEPATNAPASPPVHETSNPPPTTAASPLHTKDHPSTDNDADHNDTPSRRAPAPRKPLDEKQRSKRLFGALLGNLARPAADSRLTKKRAEIEARQHQRQPSARHQQNGEREEERAEDRQRRLEKLRERRGRVQGRVDEENMRTRHRNSMHEARFLRTESLPHLYYRPWELRPDEEDRIEDQIKEAHRRIDREVEEFEGRARGASHANGDVPLEVVNGHHSGTANGQGDGRQSDGQSNDTDERMDDTQKPVNGETPADGPGDGATKPPDEHLEAVETSRVPDDSIPTTLEDSHHLPDADDDGDHVVEGDEDTVIY